MTRILEQCKGTIKDGLCMKCFNRTATTSVVCTQMYEMEDKKAPVDDVAGHKERLIVLELHLGSDYYKIGEFHNNISNAMQEYARDKTTEVYRWFNDEQKRADAMTEKYRKLESELKIARNEAI